MGSAVWACLQGNSPICGKANQSKIPTSAMREFCAGQPNAEVIPLSVIGHENPMIYDWACKGKEPYGGAPDLQGRCASLSEASCGRNRAWERGEPGLRRKAAEPSKGRLQSES
jgi:hypothetical protein